MNSFVRALAVVGALAAPVTMIAPSAVHAQVSIGISVNLAPPPLPVYIQPPLPDVGYLWVPGYWAWDADGGDYYWVPGYWSQPPQVGVLWTPGYWGWSDGAYLFHRGYWGPTVGFYGGISYGFGYNGAGFFGGQWSNGAYQYNRSVTNVTNVTNINTTNVYNAPVAHSAASHASFNGGAGGTTATPTPEQAAAAKEKHIEPTAAQTEHEKTAQAVPGSHFKDNQGKPAVAAVAKPGVFKGAGVVPAKAPGGPAPKAAVAPATGKTVPEADKKVEEKKAPVKPVATPEKATPTKLEKAAPTKVEKAAPVKQEKTAPIKVERATPKPAPVVQKLAPRPEVHPAPQAPRPAAPHPAAQAPRPAPHPACNDPKKCH